MTDKRVHKLLKAATDMTHGKYHIQVDVQGHDDVAKLAAVLNQIGLTVEQKFREIETLSRVTEKINAGIVLEDVLNFTYDSFRPIIPYDRIGFALLDEDGLTVRAHWARSDAKRIGISRGYASKLKGSSLEKIIRTGRPRIINDLKTYLSTHPKSDSTKKIVTEGVRSSLTCPLVAMGKPIGFIFFSSRKPNTYQDVHVDLFMQIAGQLSMIVEKSRLYQQMLELNDLKNKFLGIAVHDLRSPISVINSRLDLIMEGHLGGVTDQQNSSLKSIRTWCAKMLKLVEDLLDVSAIESGKLHLDKEQIVLEPFVRECVEFNRVLAQSKSMLLTLKFGRTVREAVFDPERIHQVINNLITNAIKYSKKGTDIVIDVRKVRKDIRFAVTDQGQGILKHEMDKVFEFYGRASSMPTGGESSTGLGLAICKKMVEAHGGRIWVDSVYRKGSTFVFTIPVGL